MVPTIVETRVTAVVATTAAAAAVVTAGAIIDGAGSATEINPYLLLRQVINKIPTLEDQENWTVWELDIYIYLTVIKTEQCITKKNNPDLSNKGTDLTDKNTELDKR